MQNKRIIFFQPCELRHTHFSAFRFICEAGRYKRCRCRRCNIKKNTHNTELRKIELRKETERERERKRDTTKKSGKRQAIRAKKNQREKILIQAA